MSPQEPQDVVGVIYSVWGKYAPTAIRIAKCESNLNPHSVNYGDALITGYPSWGLFQLNRPAFIGWDDPLTNSHLAYDMFLRRSWFPWSCAKILGIK